MQDMTKQAAYERHQAELEQLYAKIYAETGHREEQAALEAVFASSLIDGLDDLETLQFEQ